MKEEQLKIPVDQDLHLVARFQPGNGTGLVIISHPHPLYGGTMDNNLVVTTQQTLAARGFATLRYDSRGVRRSQGSYGDGDSESSDLLRLTHYTSERLAPGAPVHLVGYSFGAWITLKATALELQAASLVLISPPLDFLCFEGLSLPPIPTLVIAGDRDDFCSTTSLEKWLADQHHKTLVSEVIEGADHFYGNHQAALARSLTEFYC